MLAWESCGSALLADAGQLISLAHFCDWSYLENTRMTLICPHQNSPMLSPAVKYRTEEWPWIQPPGWSVSLLPTARLSRQQTACLSRPEGAQESLLTLCGLDLLGHCSMLMGSLQLSHSCASGSQPQWATNLALEAAKRCVISSGWYCADPTNSKPCPHQIRGHTSQRME